MKLLADDQIVAPELVAYEVTNAIWKHEHLLKDIENGKPSVSIFFGLLEAGKIKILTPNEEAYARIIFDRKTARNYIIRRSFRFSGN